MQNIRQRKTEPEFRIGLRVLDEILWGLHKKEVMVIGGRPSHGKSAWGIFLLRAIADAGKRGIYFSLEMGREQLMERLFCNICRINNINLRRGYALKETEERQATFTDWIENVKILIDDVYGYEFDNLVEVCKIIKPDFIILDYIQMISTRGYRSKIDAIEEYVRRLKQLTLEMNFGAIILSQISRAGVDDPDMSKLKWSGVLEEHPDTVIIVKWDWERAEYNVRIEKQRHGEVKNVKVRFIPEYYTFEELPVEQGKEIY